MPHFVLAVGSSARAPDVARHEREGEQILVGVASDPVSAWRRPRDLEPVRPRPAVTGSELHAGSDRQRVSPRWVREVRHGCPSARLRRRRVAYWPVMPGGSEDVVTLGDPIEVRCSFAITSRRPLVASKSSDRRCSRRVYTEASASRAWTASCLVDEPGAPRGGLFAGVGVGHGSALDLMRLH
jgi:hypothetical protein